MDQRNPRRFWTPGTIAAIVLAIGAVVFAGYSFVVTDLMNRSPTVRNPTPPIETSGRPQTDERTTTSTVPPATKPSR